MALYTSLRIGETLLPGNLFLAPMAGYTDRAFREVCRRWGADFAYTEMISAEAVARGNRKTLELSRRGEGEELLGMQIFLSSAEQAERALPALLSRRPTLIDVNCGCPVPKVVKIGAGAALMNDPERIYSIVRSLVSGAEVPVTVKLRSGWSDSSITFREASRAAEEAGAAAIGFHPRTRLQGYSGHADHALTAELVKLTGIPVLASGDLLTAEDAATVLRQTGCAGLMFARGALGNPFLFAAARAALSGGNGGGGEGAGNRPGPELVLETGYRQLLQTVRYKGPERGSSEMKKHLSAYSKGLPGGAALRNALMRCTTVQGFRQVLRSYLAEHGYPPEGPGGWLEQLPDGC